MKTIYKYEVPIEDEFYIGIPLGADILCIQSQNNKAFIWVLIDTELKKVSRGFIMVGTGHKIDADISRYVGTFQIFNSSFVGHLFELF